MGRGSVACSAVGRGRVGQGRAGRGQVGLGRVRLGLFSFFLPDPFFRIFLSTLKIKKRWCVGSPHLIIGSSTSVCGNVFQATGHAQFRHPLPLPSPCLFLCLCLPLPPPAPAPSLLSPCPPSCMGMYHLWQEFATHARV